MNDHRRFAGSTLFALALLMGATPAMAADPALEQAKTLYASASFEDALAAIGRVDAAQSAEPDVLLYKALCLLALGRPQEAANTTRSLIAAAPMFEPDTTDLPPRFQTLWTDTRKATLPGVTRDLFTAARARYQAKDYVPAVKEFERVVTLTNDPAWKDSSDAADLRTLASGFMDLAQAAIPKPDPGPPPVAAAPPEPPPVAPPPPPPVLESSIVIRQDLPRWSPPDRLIAQQNYDGQVRVSIDATGKVTDVTIVKPTHRSYDVLLLRAARDWQYKPATRNGVPIASEKIVEIHLAAAAQ